MKNCVNHKNLFTKFAKNKIVAICVILIISSTALFVALPIASAHEPAWEVPTYAYLAISPNPVGVGQSVYLIFWLHGPPPTAWGVGGDRWRDFTITVTAPNGDVETLGPFDSDATGSSYTVYTPTQIGEYEFVFNYPGQVLSLYHPDNGIAGTTTRSLRDGVSGDYIGDTFLPSSATDYLTVQQDPIEKISDYPLPTEYWTRPIEGQNTAWANVASNWLGGAQLGTGMYHFWQKDGSAPGSSHIMWTMPVELGGIVGGTTDISGVGYYSGGSYEGRFQNAMIINGMLYFELPLNHAGSGGGYVCIDLRTGEEIWSADDISPSKGQLYEYESMNQHGVVGGTIWEVSGSTWIGYDAWTGEWVYNLTNVPSGFEVYTDNGEIVRYVLDAENNWLALWNNTCEQQGLHAATGTGSEAYQWRPIGKTVDMSNAYSWNVTIPDLPGTADPAILDIIPGDVILGTSSTFYRFYGTSDPYTIWAISDRDDGTRGQLLWIEDYSAPADNITRLTARGMSIDEENRVFVLYDVETMAWSGYSLDDGSQLWDSVSGATEAFSYYNTGSGPVPLAVMAYGNLYTQGYGGELICYSMTDGTVLWKYDNTNSGIETVWGNYPTFIAAVADGKVYVFNNEHSPNYPLYKNEQVRCVDAYTGDELWTMIGWAGQTGGGGASTSILAEGFLVYYNYYDNQVYCVGKGSSQTTVTAPNTAVSLGSSVVISGFVTDTSAGTLQDEQAARFPNGVPAVADECMSSWMEYV
ncbi:MAG: PQQ-binding-like beta-propeller repeat protein, partial [Candidatus Bathyarchaeota archaeon]|nr:PQQ-binding-like beta-propeller repeat protein [Candidatus Bathyarchaeum sp.]